MLAYVQGLQFGVRVWVFTVFTENSPHQAFKSYMSAYSNSVT